MSHPVAMIHLHHTAWMVDAKCSEPENRGLFWALEEAEGGERRRYLNRAFEVCRSCPVILNCRAYMDEVKPSVGMWAGVYFRGSNESKRFFRGRVGSRRRLG